MVSADKPKSGVEFASPVFILTKRATARNHVIVGDDPASIRFLEQQLGLTAESVERVTDDMLVGREGLLLRVYAAHRIDVSPETRNKTGFWSAEPIGKGSAAINALVKFAATIILPEKEQKLSRETVNTVGDLLTKGGKIHDVRGAIAEAAWLLTGDLPKFKYWPDPWEQPTAWLDGSMNPDQRLHTLYKRLVNYTIFISKGADAARKLGAKPSEIQRFKDLHLCPNCIYKTLRLLSRWKQGRISSPYVCAMQIAAIWQ